MRKKEKERKKKEWERNVEFVEFLFDFYLFYFPIKHLFIACYLSKVPIPER